MVKKAPNPKPDPWEHELSVRRRFKINASWSMQTLIVRTSFGARCTACKRDFKTIRALIEHRSRFAHAAIEDAVCLSNELDEANKRNL
jgi:hypothetical protein